MGFEPMMKVLQTSALPLGHVASILGLSLNKLPKKLYTDSADSTDTTEFLPKILIHAIRGTRV